MWLLTIAWIPDSELEENVHTYGPYDLEKVTELVDKLTDRFDGEGAHEKSYGFRAGMLRVPNGPLDIDKLAEELEKVKPGGAKRVWPRDSKA